MTAPTGEREILVDPRLRARRREIRRDQGRRRLRRLQAGLGAAAVGAGAWSLALSPVLDVDHVEVKGATRSGAGPVGDATGVDRGEALVSVDLADAERGVEALPWVATATVTRRWPGTLAVSVTERQPVAVVAGTRGASIVVDGDGRQLAVVEERAFPQLPRIVGLHADAEPGAALDGEVEGALELAQLLAGALPEGVVPEVAVVDRELEATVPGKAGQEILVRFGGAALLIDKVDALTTLMEAGALEEATPLVVDVRVPDAPVLTRTGG